MIERLKTEATRHNLVKCLLLGAFLTMACTAGYSVPVIEDGEMTGYFIVNALIILYKLLGGYGIVGAFLTVVFAILVYFTETYRRYREEQKYSIWMILLAFVFGILNVMGWGLYAYDHLPHVIGKAWFVVGIVQALGYAYLFLMASYWILLWFDRLADVNRVEKPLGSRFTKWIDQHTFLAAFLIIGICWAPWILVYYPASMDNDVFYQLDMYLGYSEATMHHPWFSTVLLGKFYDFGVAIGHENIGIFAFICFRDAVIIAIYAWGIKLLKESGLPRRMYLFVIAFFGITPVWGAYAKHAFKDTFGAALFCLYVIALIVVIRKLRESSEVELRNFVLLGLAGAIASLMRNNYIYCVIPVTLILVIYFIVKRVKWVNIVAMLLCIGTFFAYNQYAYQVVGVGHGEGSEALSIPAQQIGRVLRDHPSEISEEEWKMIETAFTDTDNITLAYETLISDSMKWRINTDEMGTFIKLWVQLGLEHPTCYLEAFIGTSYGYYSFTPKHEFWAGNWNSNMTIFNWIGCTAYPYDGLYSIQYPQFTQFLRDLMHKWTFIWDNLPVVSLTDVIALYTWFTVLIGVYFIKKKRYADLIPVFAVCLVIATCVASPVNDCFRYYAPAAASMPMLFILMTKRREM